MRHGQSEIGKEINCVLGSIALGFLLVFGAFLFSGCVACPAGQEALCPTFPNAAPRQ